MKHFLRPYGAVAFLALFFGITAFSPSYSRAQALSEPPRKIVNKVDPVYPELARKMQTSGTVRVEVVVTPSGSQKFMQVIGGNPVLAKTAVDAIENWKWVPAPHETKELIILNFRP
jgi:TonB family protein